jgi:hypothetical protein
MEVPPQNLRFPKPSFRIDEPVGSEPFEANCANYLTQVLEWRDRVLRAVPTAEEPAEQYGLSTRARLTLVQFLRSEWSSEDQVSAAMSPYNVHAFPAETAGAERCASARVLEMLRWRAGFVDYLSDVWDVIDEPALTPDECWTVGAFLRPINAELLCSFCLTPFEGDAIHPDNHRCVILGHVRAKWPPFPFGNRGKPRA